MRRKRIVLAVLFGLFVAASIASAGIFDARTALGDNSGGPYGVSGYSGSGYTGNGFAPQASPQSESHSKEASVSGETGPLPAAAASKRTSGWGWLGMLGLIGLSGWLYRSRLRP